MRRSLRVGVVAMFLVSPGGQGAWTQKVVVEKPDKVCRSVVFEGEVKAGQSFQRVFANGLGAKGLEFDLEAIASGWIVRVLPVGAPRSAHDWAELATPPYKSVTPLAVSTDFAFRAQDAVGWNPRQFRYAGNAEIAHRLGDLYARVLASDPQASTEAAQLTEEQPQAKLEILDAVLVPGTADQWRMAAAVASHFLSTPHEVEQNARPTKLGDLRELKFRMQLELPEGVVAGPGLRELKKTCLF